MKWLWLYDFWYRSDSSKVDLTANVIKFTTKEKLIFCHYILGKIPEIFRNFEKKIRNIFGKIPKKISGILPQNSGIIRKLRKNFGKIPIFCSEKKIRNIFGKIPEFLRNSGISGNFYQPFNIPIWDLTAIHNTIWPRD